MTQLHRFTVGDVDTGCGFMMCTKDPKKNFGYGDNHSVCDLTQPNIVINQINDFAKDLFEIIKDSHQDLLSIDFDGDDAFDIFLDCLEPSDIVDGAGFWDCQKCVSLFWDTVGDKNNTDVVLLNDGGIVFNKDLFITKKINHNEIGVFA